MTMPIVVTVGDINTFIYIVLAVSLLFVIVKLVVRWICYHHFFRNSERKLCACLCIMAVVIHFYHFTSGWLLFSLSSASLITVMLAWSWKSARLIVIAISAIILTLIPITCEYLLTVIETPTWNDKIYTSSFDWQVINDVGRRNGNNKYTDVFIYHDHVYYKEKSDSIQSKENSSTLQPLLSLEKERSKNSLNNMSTLTRIRSSGRYTTLNIQASKHEYQQIVLTASNALIVNSSLYCRHTLYLERYLEKVDSLSTNYLDRIGDQENADHVPCLVLPFDITIRNCTIEIDVMTLKATMNFTSTVNDTNTTSYDKDNSNDIDDHYDGYNEFKRIVLHVELLQSCDDLTRLICESVEWEFSHQYQQYNKSKSEKQDINYVNCNNIVECISPSISDNFYYAHTSNDNSYHHNSSYDGNVEFLANELYNINNIDSMLTFYNSHNNTLESFTFSRAFIENAPIAIIIKQYIHSLIDTTWKPYLWQATTFVKEQLIDVNQIKSISTDIVEYTSSHLLNWAQCCVWFTEGALFDLHDHFITLLKRNEISQQKEEQFYEEKYEEKEEEEEEEISYREQCLRRGANTVSSCAEILQLFSIYLIQLVKMLFMVIKHAILYNTRGLQYIIITTIDVAHKMSMSEVYLIIVSYAFRAYKSAVKLTWPYMLWSFKLLQFTCAEIPVLIKYLLGIFLSIVSFCYVTFYGLWLLYRETSMVTQALITVAQTVIAVIVLRTKFISQHELREHSDSEQHSSTDFKKLHDKHTKNSLPTQENSALNERIWNWFSPVWSWTGMKGMWCTSARLSRMLSFGDGTWMTIEFLFSHHKTIMRYITDHIIFALILFGLYVLPFTNIVYRFTSLIVYPWISSYHALVVWNVSMSNNCKAKPLYWQVSLFMMMRVMMCILLEMTIITLLHKILYDAAVWIVLFIIIIIIVLKHEQLKRAELLKVSTNSDNDGNKDGNQIHESNDNNTCTKIKKSDAMNEFPVKAL